MPKRDIRLINIKAHEDKYLDFSDGRLFAFVGRNKSGKSTIIQCLESIAQVKNTMNKPVQQGKESGKVIRHGQTRDGIDITIEWEVTEAGDNIFRASFIDQAGKAKVISDPKVIRELLGTYFTITVQEAFEMMKYAEGRRKFIQEYIYASLTQADRVKLASLDLMISDKKNKATENNLYHTRTAVRKDLEMTRIMVNQTSLTPAEEEEIGKIEAYRKNMERLKGIRDGRETLLESSKGLEFHLNDLEDVINTMTEYFEKWSTEEEEQEVVASVLEFWTNKKAKIEEQITVLGRTLNESATVQQRIATGEGLISAAKGYQERQERRSSLLSKIEVLEQQERDLDKQIEEAKTERVKIIEKSPLPGGLSFDEENITLNGFDFAETSLSETEARIALVELLCSISTADFVVIGDWSLYDSVSRKKIMAIAKSKNRMVFGQLVTDDEEVDCRVIIEE